MCYLGTCGNLRQLLNKASFFHENSLKIELSLAPAFPPLIQAQPVPLYKPMEVHPSEKPVTIPESPNWSKKNSRNTSKL